MERFNYQHLLYVWTVAREGSMARAGERLGLAPSTLSGQIHRFERAIGEKLFARRGRRLELTPAGRVACQYADRIFSLGQEWMETLHGPETGRPVRLVVGVLDVLPRAMVHRLLEPAFSTEADLRLVCRIDRSLDGFLADLAVYGVDLILADAPARPELPLKLFNHLLGESGTTFFAEAGTARRLRPGFPRSLSGQPFVLPGSTSAVRRLLEQWFQAGGIRPPVTLEVEDNALLYVMGEAGRGVFAAPTVLEQDIRRRHHVAVVGRASALRQRFYAITTQRRIRNPAVLAITEGARRRLLA